MGDGSWTVYIGGIYEKNSDETIVKYYSAFGRRIAMRDNAGVVHYILADHLGSSTTVTDGAGALEGTMKYYPYGAQRSVTGDMITDKLFTGQQREPRWESALGLYNYGARFYSTLMGRFVSADPLVASPGDPQMLNRYAYVRNNPLIFVDPTGMSSDLAELAHGLESAYAYAGTGVAGSLNILDCALNASCAGGGMTQPQAQDLIWEKSFWDDIRRTHEGHLQIIKLIVLGGKKGEELQHQLGLIPDYGWNKLGEMFLDPDAWGRGISRGISGLFLRYSLWDLIMGDNTIYSQLALKYPKALVGAYFWWDEPSLRFWWFNVDLQTGSDFYAHQGAMRGSGCSPGQDGCWVWRATEAAAYILAFMRGDEIMYYEWSPLQRDWLW
jgi:RHS repeat-associated protein